MIQSFDLKKAKKGAKIVTRSGKQARIVCFDRIDQKKHGNLMVLILSDSGDWEMPAHYTKEGHLAGCLDPQLDLLIDDGR